MKGAPAVGLGRGVELGSGVGIGVEAEEGPPVGVDTGLRGGLVRSAASPARAAASTSLNPASARKLIDAADQIIAAGIGISNIPDDPLPGRSYVYAPGNCSAGVCLNYVLGALLEDSANTALQEDADGILYRVNCTDPAYCVKF